MSHLIRPRPKSLVRPHPPSLVGLDYFDGAAFDATTLPGFQAGYEPSKPGCLTFAGGLEVRGMAEFSGNGLGLTHTVAGEYPSYNAGTASLDYSAAAQKLWWQGGTFAPFNFLHTGSSTVFAVFALNAAVGAFHSVCGVTTTGPAGFNLNGFMLEVFDTFLLRLWIGSGGAQNYFYQINPAGLVVGTPVIVMVRTTAGVRSDTWIGGNTAVTAGAAQTGALVAGDSLYKFGEYGSNATHGMRAVWLYDQALGNTDANALGGYLSAKFGAAWTDF